MDLAKKQIIAGPDFLVFERLAARARANPEVPLRFAFDFVDHPPDPWSVEAVREQMQAIIEAGLEADETERGLARDLIDLLLSKGHREYRSYLA